MNVIHTAISSIFEVKNKKIYHEINLAIKVDLWPLKNLLAFNWASVKNCTVCHLVFLEFKWS